MVTLNQTCSHGILERDCPTCIWTRFNAEAIKQDEEIARLQEENAGLRAANERAAQHIESLTQTAPTQRVRASAYTGVVVKRNDAVNHPPHYGGADNPYEAIKVILAWGLGFNLGNVVKYIARAGHKKGELTSTDLKKAQWYLATEIARLEEIGE